MSKNLTKQELQKQLNKIAEQEQRKLIEEYYPKFKERFEGKFFKYRNSYSCPKRQSDYWFMYTKVLSIKPDDVYETAPGAPSCHCACYTFQIDKYGNLSIEVDKQSYVHLLGKEISEKEFNNAFNKIVDFINTLP